MIDEVEGIDKVDSAIVAACVNTPIHNGRLAISRAAVWITEGPFHFQVGYIGCA